LQRDLSSVRGKAPPSEKVSGFGSAAERALKRVKLLIKSVTVIFAGGEPPLLSEKGEGGGREGAREGVEEEWRDWQSMALSLNERRLE
jgi:hypothetical protein